jgi:predicted small secreted protein
VWTPAHPLAQRPPASHLYVELVQGTSMRKLMLAIVIVAPLLASACNTIAGIGKDVSTVGGVMTDSAEKTK